MKPSLVPVVLDALFVAAQQAAPLVSADCEALDGPSRGDDLPLRCIATGWSGRPDTRGVEVEVTEQGLTQYREVIDVQGLISISSGDDGQKVVRDKAFAALAELTTHALALRGRSGVRGVERVRVSAAGLEPFTGYGAGCSLFFNVHIEGIR